jgi:hypothetical protein
MQIAAQCPDRRKPDHQPMPAGLGDKYREWLDRQPLQQHCRIGRVVLKV